MSEVIGWTIVAVIAAVVLNWGVTAWRARQHPKPLSPATDTARLQRGLVAVVLATLAQVALQADQPTFAAFGYGFAVFLFVSALRPFAPATVLIDPSGPTADSPTKSSFPPSSSDLPKSVFWQAWRYYTLDDILKGRPPVNPSLVAAESAPTDAANLTGDKTASAAHLIESGPALEKIPINFSAAVSLEPSSATIQVWTGFARPQSLCVTAQGHVFVLDGQRVYCLNPVGQIIRAWSFPEIPDLQDYRMAVSPDGQKLYLADPARGQVYSVTLNEDRL